MILLTLDQLSGHDVYEFCYDYDINFPNNWNENSLFLNSDDMVILSPYIDQIFPNFHYYGPQKITISEWKNIENLCLLEKPDYIQFFNKINNWINCNPKKCDFFWILGI